MAEIFQLGHVPYGQEFGGRLSIPYLTPSGVVNIKYRCVDLSHGDHKATSCVRYVAESGCGIHLYNAQALIGEANTVVLTEGEMDAISVQAYCGIPAVAYPGVETWRKQEHWRLCFESVGEAIVIADGDKTGKESAKRVADSLGMIARVVEMPEGMDANSFITAHGVNSFQQRITN